jgi:hypothetical protein
MDDPIYHACKGFRLELPTGMVVYLTAGDWHRCRKKAIWEMSAHSNPGK